MWRYCASSFLNLAGSAAANEMCAAGFTIQATGTIESGGDHQVLKSTDLRAILGMPLGSTGGWVRDDPPDVGEIPESAEGAERFERAPALMESREGQTLGHVTVRADHSKVTATLSALPEFFSPAPSIAPGKGFARIASEARLSSIPKNNDSIGIVFRDGRGGTDFRKL